MSLDLTDPRQLRDILKKYRLWAKKRFGQNFLVDRNVLQDILQCGNLQPDDLVVEIGPGPGVLTRELLPRVRQVIAVEVDHEILPVLKETTHFFRDRLDIIHAHILNFQPPSEPYKVIANIPYHLTSPILRKFLVETEHRPSLIVLLVQKEVAEKICNPKKRSILSLFVEVFGTAEIVRKVAAESFFPPPKVESAVLKITVSDKTELTISPHLFFNAVKQGFNQPRKKLKNNLPSALLQAAEVNDDLRPEKLSIAEWERIAQIMFA